MQGDFFAYTVVENACCYGDVLSILLAFKGGRLLALTSVLFDVVKNIKLRQLQQKFNSAEELSSSASTTS